MAPEPNPSPSPAELSAREDRLDRLEHQLAELSTRFAALDRQLSTPDPTTRPAPSPPPPNLVLSEPEPQSPPTPKASLENRLGSQVFNRIGIVALLIGATWFLKLAVDNQWIGPTGRVLIGLLAGSGLVLWSERFRRKGFPAFSYSLKALGSGVLYLSLWAAFQLYHLLPGPAALAAMLLVTTWNAWMAWSQNAELLAAYALAGGLATPLLLSTGGNHEIFLFTYLLGIDLASVALARLRSWPRLLPGALLATAAYFIGWYSQFYEPIELAVTGLFILLIAATFASPAFARQHAPHQQNRSRDRTLLEDILLPLASAAFAALALYSAFQDAHRHNLLPWLMLALSAVYLGLMRLPQTRLASAIHLSLAIVFLTVAIPLKASGAWITVAWLVEGAALLWASTRAFPAGNPDAQPGRTTLLLLSSASLLLGLGGILFELLFIGGGFFPDTRPAFLNKGFGTALTGLAAFALSGWIAYRATLPATAPQTIWYTRLAAALTITFNLVAVLAVVVQINLLFGDTRDTRLNADVALQRALAVSAFLMLYGALLLAIGFWKRSAFIRWQALILLVIAIAKTFLYDTRNLSQGYRVASFVGLGALLMAVSFAYQKDWLALREPVHTPSTLPLSEGGPTA